MSFSTSFQSRILHKVISMGSPVSIYLDPISELELEALSESKKGEHTDNVKKTPLPSFTDESPVQPYLSRPSSLTDVHFETFQQLRASLFGGASLFTVSTVSPSLHLTNVDSSSINSLSHSCPAWAPILSSNDRSIIEFQLTNGIHLLDLMLLEFYQLNVSHPVIGQLMNAFKQDDKVALDQAKFNRIVMRYLIGILGGKGYHKASMEQLKSRIGHINEECLDMVIANLKSSLMKVEIPIPLVIKIIDNALSTKNELLSGQKPLTKKISEKESRSIKGYRKDYKDLSCLCTIL